MLYRPRRPVRQFAAAIGAAIIQRLGTLCAESAFERADEGTGGLGREIAPAALAIGAHFKHHAAASWTAAQIASTTASTSPASSPSAMTRITGSVPDGRITRRPLPAS